MLLEVNVIAGDLFAFVAWMRNLSSDARDFVVDGVVVRLAMQLPK